MCGCYTHTVEYVLYYTPMGDSPQKPVEVGDGLTLWSLRIPLCGESSKRSFRVLKRPHGFPMHNIDIWPILGISTNEVSNFTLLCHVKLQTSLVQLIPKLRCKPCYYYTDCESELLYNYAHRSSHFPVILCLSKDKLKHYMSFSLLRI